MSRITLLLAWCSLYCWACTAPSTPVVNRPVFADLNIRYLADQGEMRAQASFSTGDSVAVATPLRFPKGVAFLGSNMLEIPISKDLIRYERTRPMDYVPELRFECQLPHREELTIIPVSMNGLADFQITQASLQEGLRLTIDTKLAESETLVLFFTNPNGEARTIIRKGPSRLEQLLIPADALVNFIPGDYRIYLVKRQKKTEQLEELQYNTLVEFYTKEITFTFE